MKSKLVYWLTYAGMWLLALLPFRALYILSDGVCFLMRHVVHYRRKVVRKNLKNSFPEKSEAELREIEREFYRYICDYMLEEIKMMRMSFEDLSVVWSMVILKNILPCSKNMEASLYSFPIMPILSG